MNQKEFEQRLKNLSRSAIDALEKTFGKSLTSVKEFYEKLSSMTKEARADVVKTVGVATLAVVMGVSMAGCQETTPPTDTTQIESSADETEKGTILDETTISTETSAPDETTQENNGETTKNPDPEVTTENSSSFDITTTEPETTTPNETTGEETTNVENSGDTTIEPETTTPNETTTEPEDTTTEPETTSPEEPTTSEDLPADEDGYQYSQYFADIVHNAIVNGALSNQNEVYDIAELEPKIVFVEHGPSTKITGKKYPINIYVEFTVRNNQKLTAVFAYNIKSTAYYFIQRPSTFPTYKAYVDRIEKALRDSSTLIEANASSVSNVNNLTEKQSGTLAQIIDKDFVDVDINFVQPIIGGEGEGYFDVRGFGYDETGTSYSFTSSIYTGRPYYKWGDFMAAMQDGSLNPEYIFKVETTKSEVASVFEATSASEK